LTLYILYPKKNQVLTLHYLAKKRAKRAKGLKELKEQKG
jgi:hypothetical protein